MPKTIFENCQIADTEFQDSELMNCDFGGSTFSRSTFHNCNLNQASFKDCKDYQIDPTQNRLNKTKFSFPEVIRLLDAFKIEIE